MALKLLLLFLFIEIFESFMIKAPLNLQLDAGFYDLDRLSTSVTFERSELKQQFLGKFRVQFWSRMWTGTLNCRFLWSWLCCLALANNFSSGVFSDAVEEVCVKFCMLITFITPYTFLSLSLFDFQGSQRSEEKDFECESAERLLFLFLTLTFFALSDWCNFVWTMLSIEPSLIPTFRHYLKPTFCWWHLDLIGCLDTRQTFRWCISKICFACTHFLP